MDVVPKIWLVKYNWTSDETVSVSGFTWMNGEYVSGEAFLKLLSQHSGSAAAIQKLATQLNGQFSFVVKRHSEVWLACSPTWSYPVFYCHNNDETIVSDDPDEIVKQLQSPEIDPFSKNYFLLFGVTPQNSTLVKQLKQVQPGEMVILNKQQTQHSFFFDVADEIPLQKVGEEKLHQSVLALFEKYYRFVKNKHVLLPLTRGYDSRLLACLLKEFGHTNVLCATWGRKDNVEVATAQKVAGKLGFPHIFIEYNREMISGFPAKKQFPDYAKYAGHFSSMPFLQDYFAINYLKKNQLISEKTVAMPGYSGDFFAGSHLDAKLKTADNRYLISKMVNQYSSTYPLKNRLLKEVEEYIQRNFLANKAAEPWQKYEQWDFRERQCKFISNANHAWFYFGFESVMPLFDKEFINFFKPVPLEQKLGAGLYNSTLENYFFTPHNVNFDLKSRQYPSGNKTNLKRMILKASPKWIKDLYYPLDDAIFYREITTELLQSMPQKNYRHPLIPHKYNSIIIQWYLQNVLKPEK
ncbi:MAG: asparagine synthase [Prolixibacteraceae bacterium]|nr:asparagine synthase [Prolixibacteraceae bacterium]